MWPKRVTEGLSGVGPHSQQALDAYDKNTAGFWLVVSFVYLGATVLQLLMRVAYQPWFLSFDLLMSCAFAVDYALRLYMAPHRLRFVIRLWNIADLIVIATPFLAVRFDEAWVGVLRVVRIIRLLEILWKKGGHVFQRGQVKWVAEAALGLVIFAGLIVWATERTHADSSIHTPFDALWWALVTMFTVGYGEMVPHTVLGKVGAIVLMFAGIALFGMVTAALASLFVESGSEKEAERQRDGMQVQMDDMAAQLERVEQTLARFAVGKKEHEVGTTTPQVTPDVDGVQAVDEPTQ